MMELTLDELSGGLDIQASDPAEEAFQKRAAAATELRPRDLKVGDMLDCYTPFFRSVVVIRQAEMSVIVEARVKVSVKAPLVKWHEVWAERTIDVPYIQAEGTKWQKELHIVVTQEDRSEAARAASSLVAIDPKTDTHITEEGMPFREELSVVKSIKTGEVEEVPEKKTTATAKDR